MKHTKLILFAAALLIALTACNKSSSKEHLMPGDQLPLFRTYTLFEGKNISMKDLLGRPSVIIHFNTYCPDCKLQLPEVEQAYREFKNYAAFLAIARDEDAEDVRAYWAAEGYTLPVAAPDGRAIFNLFDRGSESGVPQVYLSTPDGTVFAYADDKNPMTKEQIEQRIIYYITK